jgi:DNA modification methylase
MTDFLDGKVRLLKGDCLELLPTLEENSIDSCVTDPPYHLTSIVKRFGQPNSAPVKVDRFCNHAGADKGVSPYARASKGFMGKQWDGGDIAFRSEVWAEVLRVLKPGAHLLAFSGTRTYHRMACAIEDAGFEIRDQIGWCYGSGFPKSHNVAFGIDKMMDATPEVVGSKIGLPGYPLKPNDTDKHDRKAYGKFTDSISEALVKIPSSPEGKEWQGWGTALKPAWEPIVLARKPLSESSIAANVLRHGTGGINVDGCRVEANESTERPSGVNGNIYGADNRQGMIRGSNLGRWPANLIHDGSEEVVREFPESQVSGAAKNGNPVQRKGGAWGGLDHIDNLPPNDSGSAARFFYTAKADSDDRLGSRHPTVKPLDLIQYLVRLVTPKGGLVLDPFAGTGTTGEAAFREGFQAALIEREPEYQADIERRMALVLAGPEERIRESIKARGLVEEAGPLFGGQA